MIGGLAISCGDVNGIGFDVFLGALRQLAGAPLPQMVCFMDADTARDVLAAHRLSAEVDGSTLYAAGHVVHLRGVGHRCAVAPGTETAEAGALALASLDAAITHAMSAPGWRILTLPLSKHACAMAGWAHAGQTEHLAARLGGTPLMILASGSVRVALATVHVPLRAVAPMLTEELIVGKARILHQWLQKDCRISQPRLAVLGLNPHAGEQGRIGSEDAAIIEPAVTHLQGEGIQCHGPIPADGFFGFGAYRSYDGILAMYHDQGLIPLKLLAEGGGVNVTAGLSIMRTSPDHGTAFAIAGTNTANPASMVEALSMAAGL